MRMPLLALAATPFVLAKIKIVSSGFSEEFEKENTLRGLLCSEGRYVHAIYYISIILVSRIHYP